MEGESRPYNLRPRVLFLALPAEPSLLGEGVGFWQVGGPAFLVLDAVLDAVLAGFGCELGLYAVRRASISFLGDISSGSESQVLCWSRTGPTAPWEI